MQRFDTSRIEALGAPVKIHGVLADASCTCGSRRCRTPGKHPVGTWGAGVQRIAVDPCDDVHNYAVNPHPNVITIDIDVRDGKQGLATIATLQRELGALPPTLSVQTGSGGFHWYYRVPLGTSVIHGLPGDIDLKGHRGYLVVPRSTHACGGVYEWLDNGVNEPVMLPDAWLAKVRRPPTRQDVSTCIPVAKMLVQANVEIFAQRDDEVLLRCPCDEHVDRRPSCWVSLSRGLWICFSHPGAGGAGNAYSLARHLRCRL